MIKLAIDLGSSVTKIYRADASNGIVLAEPSCVAVSGMEREIKAIGKEAKKLMGKTAEFTEIVFPVYEGEIVDARLAVVMLKEFLSRIGIKSARLKRSETLFSVPCGASERLKADYAALAEECGLKRSPLRGGALFGGARRGRGSRRSESRILSGHRRRRHQRGGGVSGRHYRGACP